MSTDNDLVKIVDSLRSLEDNLVKMELINSEDEAEFKRLIIEAKALLDDGLGVLNDFSSNLFRAINSGSGNIFGAPTLTTIRSARAIIDGGINQIR